METNAFRDAEELLASDPGFWVFWTEEVFDPYEDVYVKKSGAYHWLMDVYVMVMNQKDLVITFGHPDESEWFYTTDPDLIRAYKAVLNQLLGMNQDIQSEIDSRA